MSKLIGLQAGHQNIQGNADPILRTQTGAQGEEPFNVKVRDALGQILISKGFQVQLDDANSNINPQTLGKHFDFYLSIHAQASVVGGAVSAPDPSVDQVNGESKRIVEAMNQEYFKDTGIVRNDSMINPNMTQYYMWAVLEAKTPCGIIECGDLSDPHDSVILADTQRVALGIAHGICDAFGVAWGTPAPNYQKLYNDEVLAHQTDNKANAETIQNLKAKLGQGLKSAQQVVTILS